MNKKVLELLESYRAEMTETLRRWVQTPSVKGEAAPGAPFGPDVRRMLDTAIADLAAMGFSPKDYDGYACDASLGEAAEQIAVLGHLDVVPIGDGWVHPPFGAVVENNRVYGRGTNDDKGPMVACLYAMKAIREAGIPLKKGIRVILGCDEESGWEDMAWYKAHAEMPKMGFSPDASFPLINTEKGMIHLALRAKDDPSGLPVLRLATGDRVNVIPGECRALVAGGEEIAEKVRQIAKDWQLPYTVQVVEGGVEIVAEGIPGHSAYPEGRRNAIGMMIRMLRALGAAGPIATLAQAVGTESDGASLGCACADEVSGALTCNMGILRLEDGAWFTTLDFRCPITADLDHLAKTAIAHLPGWDVEITSMKEPHHVPEDSELVQSLLAAYNEETGEEGRAEATGGGTYAKVIQQGVAFGANFPGDEDMAHQADEYIDLDRMMTAAKIYANALIRLAGA